MELNKYEAVGQCLKDLAAGLQSKQVEICVAGHENGGWHVAGDVRTARCQPSATEVLKITADSESGSFRCCQDITWSCPKDT